MTTFQIFLVLLAALVTAFGSGGGAAAPSANANASNTSAATSALKQALELATVVTSTVVLANDGVPFTKSFSLTTANSDSQNEQKDGS